MSNAVFWPAEINDQLGAFGLSYSTQGETARLSLKVKGIPVVVDLTASGNSIVVQHLTARIIFGIPLPSLRGMVVQQIAQHLESAGIVFTVDGNTITLQAAQTLTVGTLKLPYLISGVGVGPDGLARACVQFSPAKGTP